MNSKKETASAVKEKARRKRVPSRQYTAAEKTQAVLAIWTERVKPVAVMRTLGVNYMTLQHWQNRAMEGMLQALESRANLSDGTALSPRLRALLQKRQLQVGPKKLAARLERLQEVAPESSSESNA
jgi:transposase-like protein